MTSINDINEDTTGHIIMYSDWLRAFPVITQDYDFSQIGHFYWKTENIDFYYKNSDQKLKTKLFKIVEKPHFWDMKNPSFGTVLTKFIFVQRIFSAKI